ncbi:hypothetical protein OK016_20930 [Vibrio chagasii]|nr:hypothetical protein [Vibrio chagasii]
MQQSKGVNVSKVLSELGAKVTVTGFLGRNNEEAFAANCSNRWAQLTVSSVLMAQLVST